MILIVAKACSYRQQACDSSQLVCERSGHSPEDLQLHRSSGPAINDSTPQHREYNPTTCFHKTAKVIAEEKSFVIGMHNNYHRLCLDATLS